MEILSRLHSVGLGFLTWLALLVVAQSFPGFEICPINVHQQSGSLNVTIGDRNPIKGPPHTCSVIFHFPSQDSNYVFYVELGLFQLSPPRPSITMPDGSHANFRAHPTVPYQVFYSAYLVLNQGTYSDVVKNLHGKYEGLSVLRGKGPLTIHMSIPWHKLDIVWGIDFKRFNFTFIPLEFSTKDAEKKGNGIADGTGTPNTNQPFSPNTPEKQTGSVFNLPFIIVLSLLVISGGISAFLAFKIRQTSSSSSPTDRKP